MNSAQTGESTIILMTHAEADDAHADNIRQHEQYTGSSLQLIWSILVALRFKMLTMKSHHLWFESKVKEKIQGFVLAIE